MRLLVRIYNGRYQMLDEPTTGDSNDSEKSGPEERQ